MYAKFHLHLPYGFWEEEFLIFLRKFILFAGPRQPIKFNDLDKSQMKRRGLLNKHFCKCFSKYTHWDRKNGQFPLFLLYTEGL